MNATIETQNLMRRYGNVTAVDDFSLRVEPGEIYAFLGLNGAVKTTTIRMLLEQSNRLLEAHVLGTKSSCWWQKTVAMPAFRTCQSIDAPARITHP